MLTLCHMPGLIVHFSSCRVVEMLVQKEARTIPQDAQAAGDEEWWKLREAALLAVGAVADPLLQAPGSSDRDFDLASFLNSCLAEDLSASSPPYLLGRALWVALRYA